MNQVLHIFRKDTRRFWPEILVTLAATAAFAWIYPAEWTVYPNANMMTTFAGITVALMTIGWWVLATRVVQDERLVGNEQFWITRPYRWGELLAAKVLFLCVWAGLPFLLAQHWLVHVAGFTMASHASLMVWTTLDAGLVLLLPIFVIAALTLSFARTTMTVLGGVVLLIVGMFVADARIGTATQNPYHNAVFRPVLLIGAAVALLVIYRTRRAWPARLIALAVPVLLMLSYMAYNRQSLVDRAYPAPAAGALAPVSASLAITPIHPVKARSYQGNDFVDLPVAYNGVAQGGAVFADNFRYTITTADGTTWNSRWERIIERVRPEHEHLSYLSLRMKPQTYTQFRGRALTVTVEFALSRYAEESPQTSAFPKIDGEIAGIGRCMSNPDMNHTLLCRAPVHQPKLSYITTTWTKGNCDAPPQPGVASAGGYTWLDREGGPDFDISSVWERNIFFWNHATDDDNPDSDHPGRWSICPGVPIVVTHYHLIDRTRTTMTLTGFTLPENVDAT